MNLSQEQYNELVEKLAAEIIDGALEKEAKNITAVSPNLPGVTLHGKTVKAIAGIGPDGKGGPASFPKKPNIVTKATDAVRHGADEAALHAITLPGLAKEKIQNAAGATKKKLIDALGLEGYHMPYKTQSALSHAGAGLAGAGILAGGLYAGKKIVDAKKEKEQAIAKKACELLEEAAAYKQAAEEVYAEAELYKEAAELALSRIGYSLE